MYNTVKIILPQEKEKNLKKFTIAKIGMTDIIYLV